MSSWETQFESAQIAIRRQDYESAAQILRQLVFEYPNNSLFRWRLGTVELQMGEPQKAVELFRKAIELDGRSIAAWGGLGLALIDLEDWDNAEAAIRKRLEIKPVAHYFVLLASVLSAKGDVQGAIDACKVAVEMDPLFEEAYLNLGGYCYVVGLKDEAEKALKRALELEPEYSKNVARIRRTYGNKGSVS